MATVNVKITDRSVISALNTPGGPVWEFRDDVMNDITDLARRKSPVNNPANARHRGGRVGTYKASWLGRRHGSGHHVGLTVMNTADHAQYVEEGKGPSRKFQRFSFTGWGGEIRYIGPKVLRKARAGRTQMKLPWGGRKVAGRPGKHILRDSTNRVLASWGRGGVA